VRTYNDFADLSESGTLGDPSLASAEAGARFHDAVVQELVIFLEEFAGWRLQESR
jgi:creatinine amidohydrolase/Fe(II)-dependent formamide hydrolase-like protein